MPPFDLDVLDADWRTQLPQPAQATPAATEQRERDQQPPPRRLGRLVGLERGQIEERSS